MSLPYEFLSYDTFIKPDRIHLCCNARSDFNNVLLLAVMSFETAKSRHTSEIYISEVALKKIDTIQVLDRFLQPTLLFYFGEKHYSRKRCMVMACIYGQHKRTTVSSQSVPITCERLISCWNNSRIGKVVSSAVY